MYCCVAGIITRACTLGKFFNVLIFWTNAVVERRGLDELFPKRGHFRGAHAALARRKEWWAHKYVCRSQGVFCFFFGLLMRCDPNKSVPGRVRSQKQNQYVQRTSLIFLASIRILGAEGCRALKIFFVRTLHIVSASC